MDWDGRSTLDFAGHNSQYQYQQAQGMMGQQQAPPPAYDPYGGYDAVNYPSIPALIEHSQRAASSSSSYASSQPSRRGAEPSGAANHYSSSASRASKPQAGPFVSPGPFTCLYMHTSHHV